MRVCLKFEIQIYETAVKERQSPDFHLADRRRQEGPGPGQTRDRNIRSFARKFVAFFFLLDALTIR